MDMESLNKVELQGRIGDASIINVENKIVAKFSVGTTYAYKDKDGEPWIECVWHNCEIWDSDQVSVKMLTNLKRGDAVNVKGRISTRSWTTANGEEKVQYIIKAQELTLLDS
jgi:single stranded DNA-binding protein